MVMTEHGGFVEIQGTAEVKRQCEELSAMLALAKGNATLAQIAEGRVGLSLLD